MPTRSRLSALLLGALLLAAPARAQSDPPPDSVLVAALDAMQAMGYYASRVDWPSVRARARARVASDPAATHDAIREALAALGDGHSFLLTPQAQDGLAPAAADDAPRFTLPVGRVLDGDARGPVGYVRVPFFMGADPGRFADSLLAVVRRVDAARPVGWIVDVRHNGGGNIWPMLAGLGPVLGDGPAGGFVGADGARETAVIRGTDALVVTPDTMAVVMRAAPRYRPLRPGLPVAVLIDGATASSAEGVALAFEGRPRARRFGVPTSGQSSANEGRRLPDGSVLVVTTGMMLDRAGHAYGVPLVPDEVAPDDPATPADETLDAARTWLLAQP